MPRTARQPKKPSRMHLPIQPVALNVMCDGPDEDGRVEIFTTNGTHLGHVIPAEEGSPRHRAYAPDGSCLTTDRGVYSRLAAMTRLVVHRLG